MHTSDRQNHILHAIYQLTQTDNCPPTLKEIAEECGLSSASSVHYHIEKLLNKKLIQRATAKDVKTKHAYIVTAQGTQQIEESGLLRKLNPKITNSTLGLLAESARWPRINSFEHLTQNPRSKVIYCSPNGCPAIYDCLVSENASEGLVAKLTPEAAPQENASHIISNHTYKEHEQNLGYIYPATH